MTIDTSIYARVQPLRAPNSAHPKTGLHKRRLAFDELMHLSTERIVELAREPHGFELPIVTANPPQLATDWQDAEAAVQQHQRARPAGAVGTSGRLNRATLEFIQHGAEEGERTNRLFQASANLREFNAPPELVHALLTEAALDSGLRPTEVARVIGCGIEYADRKATGKDGAA